MQVSMEGDDVAAERARVAALPTTGPEADSIVLRNLRRVYPPQVPSPHHRHHYIPHLFLLA